MKTVFALSKSLLPCAVTQFTRQLAAKVGGLVSDLSSFKAIKECDNFVINLPLVGWKKTFFKPIFAQIYALSRGKKCTVVLHEWADLNWKRRLVIAPLVMFAHKICVSSPLILQQLESSMLHKFIFSQKQLFVVPPLLTFEKTAELPRDDKIRIGHFGSIYPSKNSLQLLDIAYEFKKNNQNFEIVFIGDFVKDSQDVEAQFHKKVEELGLNNHVKVTGYVADLKELFLLFQQMSCFLYPFSEGLTARRTSILAVAQAGRPIITTKPQLAHEFNHHPAFQEVVKSGILYFGDNYSEAIMALSHLKSEPLFFDKEQLWVATVKSII